MNVEEPMKPLKSNNFFDADHGTSSSLRKPFYSEANPTEQGIINKLIPKAITPTI